MTEEADVTATPAASGDTAPAVPETPTTDKLEGQEPESKPDAASDPAQPKEPKKVDPRQKKIAELSYQTREQQRRIDQLMGMVEKQINQPRQADDRPPNVGDLKSDGSPMYATLEEYLEARDEYREKAREAKANPGKDQPDPRYVQAVQAARDDLYAAGAEKYEDFEEVVGSDDVKITVAMRDAIFALDDQELQAEVSYYLGKNPKEAARIAKLPPVRQIAEIGKLEVKVSSQPTPTKRPSAAPAPIAPVGGSNTNTNTLTGNESMKDFIAKRNRQLGRK